MVTLNCVLGVSLISHHAFSITPSQRRSCRAARSDSISGSHPRCAWKPYTYGANASVVFLRGDTRFLVMVMEDSFQSTVPEEAKNKEEGGREGGPLCILKRTMHSSGR